MSYCSSICPVPYVSSSGVVGSGAYGLVPVYGSNTLSPLVSGLGSSYSGYGLTCSNQLPGSEVVIQPPTSVVSIPGPIISGTTDPISVSQVAGCGYGYPFGSLTGSTYGGLGRLGYYGYGGYGGYGGLGSLGSWRRYSRKCLPYYSYGSY